MTKSRKYKKTKNKSHKHGNCKKTCLICQTKMKGGNCTSCIKQFGGNFYKTASPIPYDSYKKLRVNGGAILIDETSHVTVGACMIQ